MLIIDLSITASCTGTNEAYLFTDFDNKIYGALELYVNTHLSGASVLASSRLIGVNCIRIMHQVIAHLSRKTGLQSRRDTCM